MGLSQKPKYTEVDVLTTVTATYLNVPKNVEYPSQVLAMTFHSSVD